jgi:hypothetical protein
MHEHIGAQVTELIKNYVKEHEGEYVNPHFLVQIKEAVEDYYHYEDGEMDEIIERMFNF